MSIPRISLSLLSISLLLSLLSTHAFASKKSYIVYLGAHSHGPLATSVDYEKVRESHYGFLSSFLGSKAKAKDAIFYSYTKNINGFSVNLEEEEAAEISKHPDVITVFLNKEKKLQTTRSWEFLGLEKNGLVPESSLMYRAKFGKDVIIANLDTGVWPESASFNDKGLGPVPSKWRGKCQTNTSTPVKCNRKLIGASMYSKGYEAFAVSINESVDPTTFSPRDTEGHGSHTLSTAGGRMVPANVYGHANGTAMGGSPDARVAAYKICWPSDGCFDSDILAGFDAAIYDGVDVINLSVGGEPADYFIDSIAIGSFHAIRNGIIVVASAGNSGPESGTVSNVAPWILTVGASTIDRSLQSVVYLGNMKHYNGVSLSQNFLLSKFYPLINAAHANAANYTATDSELCIPGSLDPAKVKGKIVLCTRGLFPRVQKSYVVKLAGGAGMILANTPEQGNEILTDFHFLPAIHISAKHSAAVFSYINSTNSPIAHIQPVRTKLNLKPAPTMAVFSSVGPNTVNPEILKPDITAPGVNILAAFSEAVGPSGLSFDNRRVPFVLLSGTSMSSPHVAGIAGLLKSLHPDWSPAAIRSAIMTSAGTRDNTGEPIITGLESSSEATPFNYGAGHVRPNRAMNPGLVYDLTTEDYLNFLCTRYNSTQLKTFYHKPYACPPKNVSLLNFNYPSITVPSLTNKTIIVSRRVKNVGPPGTYKVRFSEPHGVSLSIQPQVLKFRKAGEEKTFSVTLTPKSCLCNDDYAFGKILWTDGRHHVRSPIVVKKGA